MKKKSATLYYITAGWALFMLVIGMYFLAGSLSPTADVYARLQSADYRISIGHMKPGDINVYRLADKPVVIWRRNAEEMATAMAQLKPGLPKEEWLSLIKDGTLAKRIGPDRMLQIEWIFVSPINVGGLGCIVLSKAGDFHGFFDPCQGVHFDMWGHPRSGPTVASLMHVPAKVAEDGLSVMLNITEMPSIK